MGVKPQKLQPYPPIRKIDGFTIYYIDTTEQLHEAVSHLKRASELSLDLEFDRNRHHYGFTLCLVQIAYDDCCYLIDPLSTASTNPLTLRALQPLWEVLANPSITKILHSPSEDIRLLKLSGCAITQLFDTDTAAKLSRIPTTSYKDLLAKRLGIDLEKDQQTSDWCKRPLSPFQLQYAAKDVLYLSELRQVLQNELAEMNRTEWFAEEMKLIEGLEEAEVDEPHLRIKGAKHLTATEQHLLKSLYQYRDQQARTLNKPPYQTIEDSVLLSLIADPAHTLEHWTDGRNKHPRLRTEATVRTLANLLNTARTEAQQQGLATSPYYPTPAERAAAYQRRLELEQCRDLFKPLRERLAATYGEAATLLFTTKIADELCSGKRTISNLKQYTQPIVRQTAHELGIDLSPYE